MEATLTGLDFACDYGFVAFITTDEGTFYGEEQIFKPDSAPTGIEEVETVSTQRSYPTGIYDLNGRRLSKMQRGFNVVKYEDGSIKKVLTQIGH